jgi:hypothetical protein
MNQDQSRVDRTHYSEPLTPIGHIVIDFAEALCAAWAELDFPF